MSWLSMIPAAIGAVSGIVGGISANKRAKKAQQQQVKDQQMLNEEARKGQLDIWNKTNYKQQVQHLKDAGLNTALLYGQGGGGGATTGAAPTGAASKADVTPITTGGTMELGLMNAQKKVLETQAAKNEAEASVAKADAENKGYINKSITPEVIDAMTEKALAETGGARERERELKLANDFETWLQRPETMNGVTMSQKERQVRTTINKALGEIQEIDSEIKKNTSLTSVFNVTKNQIEADTALKQQLKEQLDKVNPVELETILKQLEILKNDPANSQIGQYINFTTKSIADVIDVVGTVRGFKGIKEAVSTYNTNTKGEVSETHQTRTRGRR